MFGRGTGAGAQQVPFAFVAEADRFRDNVTPPPRERAGTGEIAGRVLIGLVVVSGLVGSLLLGMPALDVEQQRDRVQQQEQAGHSR
ncbi:hypothetical protein [Streptomyces alkaliterrae]|uniref:Uncharacterized protein n=1 Tax=Streptomyces alkaliterrae TaxID=2213162 RepID=A0A5P0YR35_9ACTN|nr:hypothetical protein [Streptomyces alkaliterrae]MBB1254326.1 hypothetical protein [Streptomyces alkaliterrae]MBB1260817.1 hypothetical protein [Streptomyces alkaliterrae]MQS02725.1 hypothetical protein [Streptomyces alkaliterrae]